MDKFETLQILEKELLSLLPILDNYIPQEGKLLLEEFIDHCECGLAYEDIIATINFHKIQISIENYEKIKKIGQLMKFEEVNWLKLKDLVIAQE